MAYQTIPAACFGARARHGHTQGNAATAVGRSLRTWKAWESGESLPSAKHLSALATYTGVRLTDLVGLVQHAAHGVAEPADATVTNGVVS